MANGIWRRSMEYLGLVEEDAPGAPVRADDGPQLRDRMSVAGRGAVRALGTTLAERTATRVRIAPVTAFEQCEEIGSALRNGDAVLIDLAETDLATGRRVLDFTGGVTHTLEGSLKPLGNRRFAAAPRGAVIDESERERLAGLGYEWSE